MWVGRIQEVAKIWQELGISPWMRERTPLVYYDEQLITAIGCFITPEGLVADEEIGVAFHWDKFDEYQIEV